MDRKGVEGGRRVTSTDHLWGWCPLRRERASGGSASIAFAVVSQQSWGSGEWSQLPGMPMVHFSNYSQEQMVACMLKVNLGVLCCTLSGGIEGDRGREEER